MNKLIQKIIGEADIEATTQHSAVPGELDGAMTQIRERFVEERVHGFKDPTTGQAVGPVSREQAEAAWQRIEPQLRRLFRQAEPGSETSRMLGLHQSRDVYNYRNPNAQ